MVECLHFLVASLETRVRTRLQGERKMATVSAPGLQAATVLTELASCGVTHIVWLPDSETGFMYKAMLDSQFTLVPVCRGGEAIAVAAGLVAGGKKPVVLIQST